MKIVWFSHLDKNCSHARKLTIKDKPAIQHGRLKDGGEEEELLLLVVDGLGTNYFCWAQLKSNGLVSV